MKNTPKIIADDLSVQVHCMPFIWHETKKLKLKYEKYIAQNLIAGLASIPTILDGEGIKTKIKFLSKMNEKTKKNEEK